MAENKGSKKLTVVFPEEIWDRIVDVSRDNYLTYQSAILQLIKVGLIVIEQKDKPDGDVLIKNGENLTSVRFII